MKGRQYERAIWLNLTYEAKCLLRRYPAAPRLAAMELAETVRTLIETQMGGPVADDLVLRVAKRAVLDSRPPKPNPGNGPHWPQIGPGDDPRRTFPRLPPFYPGDGSGSREPRRPLVPSLSGCIECPVPDDALEEIAQAIGSFVRARKTTVGA